MTQEELDALVSGSVEEQIQGGAQESAPQANESEEVMLDNVKIDDYQPKPGVVWPPPPPNKEHKVVHQLDDVTRDSEEKATEIMDKLESISNFFADSESLLNDLNQVFDKNIDIFSKLNDKFPNVESFSEALNLNQNIKNKTKEMSENLQSGQDEVMIAMDTMQYQDIHRQKIERVINVMRALNRYMSSLFAGKIDDSKRVSSATHIEGDNTVDVVSNDDIEALIASLGQK